MEKVLLLCGKNTTLFDFEKSKIQVTMDDLYRGGRFNKYLIHFPLLAKKCLGNWKRELGSYDCIIFFDSNLTKQTINALKQLKFRGRKVLFFRNQITKRNLEWDLDSLKKSGIEIWSYNLGDCRRYKLKYNNETLSYKKITNKLPYDGEKYDLVFIGDNKGREDLLIKLDQYCKSKGINNYFYVMNAPNYKNNQCKDNSYMNYADYLKIIQNCKAILDLVETNNYGLTFRPIEALFLSKKLITNYFELKDMDFYEKDNIYYLDDSFDFGSFLKKLVVNTPINKVMNYDSNDWIMHFFEE